MNSNEMIWIDLPSLQSITLGKYALCGRRSDYSCSLIMRSTNEMIRNEWNVDLPNLTAIYNFEGDSFYDPGSVTLESISIIENWII